MWLSLVWGSGESHFYLNGVVNKVGCLFYGSEKSDKVLQNPLHSAKVTVWATIIGPFGPFFFESVEGKAQTINTERYIEKPEIFKQTLRQRRFDLRDQRLMQSGAARYTSGECLR